jgi:hypothetical protein
VYWKTETTKNDYANFDIPEAVMNRLSAWSAPLGGRNHPTGTNLAADQKGGKQYTSGSALAWTRLFASTSDSRADCSIARSPLWGAGFVAGTSRRTVG